MVLPRTVKHRFWRFCSQEIRGTLETRVLATVYITFDLDCLDPSVAPAVSNIEPGVKGFSVDEAIELMHAVRGMNIIGGDVVCLMPTKDSPNQITAMVAAAVMFEMISMIAELKIKNAIA